MEIVRQNIYIFNEQQLINSLFPENNFWPLFYSLLLSEYVILQ